MVLSRNKLKKCASNIRKANRNNKEVELEDLETIHEYRNQHKDIICSVFNDLCDISKKVHNNAVVVFRLKKIDTIVRKLSRVETSLDRLQDIAGCRVIVDSIAQVYAIVDKLNNSSQIRIKRTTDYIEKPRDSGYKSYHLIVEKVGFEHEVEIQIRTRNHHYWATFVEIIDHTFHIKIKEGDENFDILRIHKLLSKSEENNLIKKEKVELILLESKLNMIHKVLKLFRRNYLIASKNWIEASTNNDLNYILLEVMNDEPDFQFFETFEEAESIYFEKFKGDVERNMVIININQPDINKLFLAYSNYVLVSHPFITRLIEFLFEVILISKKEGDYKTLRLLVDYKEKLLSMINDGFITEKEFIDEIHINNKGTKKTDNIISWYLNLVERSVALAQKSVELEKQLKVTKPKLTLKTLYPRFIYWLNN